MLLTYDFHENIRSPGDNAVERGSYEAAEKRTTVLLSVFQYPLGTPVAYNDSIQLMSEDVGFAPGIKTGKDYITLMSNNMKRSNLPVETQGEPVKLTLAGHTFYRQDFFLNVRGKSVCEAFVVTILKEHALAFVFVAENDDARNTLTKTLETMRLNPTTDRQVQ
jgi:hypothetical protein